MESELKKLLADPRTKIVPFELTPEVKKRLLEVSEEVLDVLIKGTRGPAEAAMVLHYVSGSLQTWMEEQGFPLKGIVETSNEH